MIAVVAATLHDDQYVIFDLVDQSMLLVDSPGPTPREIAFQRFWFTRALKRIPQRRLDQIPQTFELPWLLSCPLLDVFECFRLKFQPHP